MKKRYVELDGVVFLAPDGDLYTRKATGGKWVPNPNPARAKSFGMPVDESEAKAVLGDVWPQEEKAA